jgi:hypothetical protein
LKITFACLEKLIRFIEKEYAQFLNVNINVINRSTLLYTYGVKSKIKHIDNKLILAEINEKLKIIAVEPLIKIASDNINEKLTYKEFNYCLEYINELHKYVKSRKTVVTNNELHEWIFSFNLNTLTFFDYKTDILIEEMSKYESGHEKLEYLYKKHKIINQRQTRSINTYNNVLPPIKHQIIGWLEEEIEYLTKKMELDQPIITIPGENKVKAKILSGVSVAQLSYMFNLLAQVGVINQKNQRDIFRFISDNFKTNLADQISADSVKSKYYNVESSTKAAVREKMIEILNLTKL